MATTNANHLDPFTTLADRVTRAFDGVRELTAGFRNASTVHKLRSLVEDLTSALVEMRENVLRYEGKFDESETDANLDRLQLLITDLHKLTEAIPGKLTAAGYPIAELAMSSSFTSLSKSIVTLFDASENVRWAVKQHSASRDMSPAGKPLKSGAEIDEFFSKL